MKPNIFQKIALLVYISVIVLICVYFVPYHGTQNHLGLMMENIKRDSSYHSNILDEGFGTISYFRFLFYLGIPGLLVYFVYGYLDKLNDLDTKVYYKKAKNELYIFLLFILINLGLIFFLGSTGICVKFVNLQNGIRYKNNTRENYFTYSRRLETFKIRYR